MAVVKNPADKQEVFNYVVNALRKQGCKSTLENSVACMYRGPNGLKCAAGHLIPDEDYSPKFENKTVFKGTAVGDYLISQGYDFYFLCRLQSIHDEYRVEDWEKEFEVCANSYGLNFFPRKDEVL